MRDFLILSCPWMIWIITVIELVLIVIFALLFKKVKNKKIMVLCMMLITCGLFIDALFISLGTILDGATLKAISPARYISHGVLIPLLFPICLYSLTEKKLWKIVVWAITGALMLAGLMEGIFTDLEMKEFAGVIRFVASDNTPAWAESISSILSFGTVIPLMIVGVIVWIKQKTPHLFLSGFLMFAFSALGPATGNSDLIFYISMFGEVLMVLFFLFYARKTVNTK